MSKNIAIYFTEQSTKGYPLNIYRYRKSYFDFFNYCNNQYPEINFYIVRGKSYLGDGIFEYGQYFNNKKRKLELCKKKIHSDVIYNKGDLPAFSNDKANIVNDLKFDRLCKSKMRSALLFPKYFPESIEIKSRQEILNLIDRVKTDKVVIKPADGFGSINVKVKTKQQLKRLKKDPSQTMVMQEFLDTSCGIPGITKKTHDLRVVIMNGKIVTVFLRHPGIYEDVFKIEKGGTFKEVSANKLPDDILNIIKTIENKFKKYYPKVYSIDFAYTKNGPRIFELNSQPGLPPPEAKKYYKKWHQGLFDVLLHSL